MSGLILKDLYMVVKRCKMYLLLGIIFIAVSFFGDNNIIFLALPILLTGIIPITLLAYDERSRWTEYCGSLPYTKAQIVSAKYLTGLLIQTAVSVVAFVVLLARSGDSDTSISNSFSTVLSIFTVTLLFPAICMPFSLKYGTEKGRVSYYVAIAAVMGTAWLVLGDSDNIAQWLNRYADIYTFVLVGFMALYILSWIWSIVIYNNKELG